MEHILVVDDEKNYRLVLAQLLEEAGYRVSTADNAFAALELMGREGVSLVLSDLRMPRMDGLEFFYRVREAYGEIPFVILTAFATVETALDAVRAGVFDYLLKPFKNEELLLTLEKALAWSRLQTENAALRRQLENGHRREIIGESPAVRKLLDDIARVAPARSSVLVMGESGTGKELVARALHRASSRAQGPLVTINCASFAENLLESELFGHERGAFTGAVERKKGLVEMANGGTLFLDEIGEMPLSLQPKLLRLLQEKRFRRVGGTAEIQTDVRIIAATHRCLKAMIAEGAFREDLYYRLNVVCLHLPPLRERVEDIPLLSLAFLKKFGEEMGRRVTDVSAGAMAALQSHQWPGNVRELQNVLERGVLFSTGCTLGVEELPEYLRGAGESHQAFQRTSGGEGLSLPERLDLIEEQIIRDALVEARGVQARAADALGISRSNLQYKLRKYSIE